MMLSNGKVAPMDKLPNSEIVKALKCCVSEMDCPNCPKKKDGVECVGNLLRDCFDLINRQKAENKNFQERNVILRGLVDTQKAENERLNNTLDAMVLEHKRLMKTVKTEAYKECIEKIKSHSRKMKSSDFSGEFWDKAVLVADIDNILKEKVGDSE